jgi:peptidoglycan/xylan/chitin deacetylase (PgdA/CDA1 family)
MRRSGRMTIHPAWFTGGGVCAAAGIYAWGATVPSSQLFGRTMRRTGDRSSMALTFDDGPNPAATPQLLDLLARYEAKATFFLIGRHVRAFPALAKEVVAGGHAIGNHTESHPSLALLSSARIKEELDRCDETILSNAMVTPRWMRPPYGFRSPLLHGIVRRRGNAGVAMWSAEARDWKIQAPGPVIQRLHSARGGDIVLLHDGDHRVLEGDRRHVVKALEHWLPRWKDSGLRFVSMDEIEKNLRAD